MERKNKQTKKDLFIDDFSTTKYGPLIRFSSIVIKTNYNLHVVVIQLLFSVFDPLLIPVRANLPTTVCDLFRWTGWLEEL